MKCQKVYVLIFSLCALWGPLVGIAHSSSLKNQVARAVALAEMSQQGGYTVEVVAHFKHEKLLKDYMMRHPRHPARSRQVISVHVAQKKCVGTLVSNGTRVVTPEVCVSKGDYTLEKMVVRFSNGQKMTLDASDVSVKEDVAWLRVDPIYTKELAPANFLPVAQGKSLQDVFGADMTDHLKRFFHARGVVERRRCRVGRIYGRPRLKVGEPLFYNGELVALVKQSVRTYGGLFGGVSESAFAIIR